MTNGMSENIKRDCIMVKTPLMLAMAVGIVLISHVYGDDITNIGSTPKLVENPLFDRAGLASAA